MHRTARPLHAILAAHARETWSAPAIGIGRRPRWRRCRAGAGACGSGSPTPHVAAHHDDDHGGAAPTSTTTTTATPGLDAAAGVDLGAVAGRARRSPFPFSADRVTAAESPDGAVFAAPQDPTSPSPSVAWVVDGNGPAAIAEHVPTGIAALAADGTNFYVATYSTVFAYNRTSGNQDGQWTMPAVHAANSSNNDLVALAAADGGVLRLGHAGQHGQRVPHRPGVVGRRRTCSCAGWATPSGPTAPSTTSAPTTSLAVRRPNGATAVGPVLADTPNGLGGGVQYLDVVAGGAVWVSEPAGQGLDATLHHLRRRHAARARDLQRLGDEHAWWTPPPGRWCSSRPATTRPARRRRRPRRRRASSASMPQGAVSDPVGVGSAVTLLGPGPAVVVSDTATGQFDLMRLS